MLKEDPDPLFYELLKAVLRTAQGSSTNCSRPTRAVRWILAGLGARSSPRPAVAQAPVSRPNFEIAQSSALCLGVMASLGLRGRPSYDGVQKTPGNSADQQVQHPESESWGHGGLRFQTANPEKGSVRWCRTPIRHRLSSNGKPIHRKSTPGPVKFWRPPWGSPRRAGTNTPTEWESRAEVLRGNLGFIGSANQLPIRPLHLLHAMVHVAAAPPTG